MNDQSRLRVIDQQLEVISIQRIGFHSTVLFYKVFPVLYVQSQREYMPGKDLFTVRRVQVEWRNLILYGQISIGGHGHVLGVSN